MAELKKMAELKEIKVMTRAGKTKEGKSFTAFKCVQENGKLVDLHFKRDVELSKFDGLKKFAVKVGYYQLAENYEFPRIYVGDVDYDSIVNLYN